MSPTDSEPPRARVAEARRNRQNLIAVATKAFSFKFETSLVRGDCQAGRGGIGTLYRHFPTREALVEAVYHDQEDHLRTALSSFWHAPPTEALRLWMDLFVDWAVTKHGMIDTLRVIISSGRLEFAQMRAELVVVYVCSRRRIMEGEIRPDADAETIAATLAGILDCRGETEQRDQAARC